jgi:hypothetical protein
MALTGMHAWQPYAYNTGDGLATVTWSASFAPADAFTQVHLANYFEYGDQSSSEIWISQVTNSKGQKTDFPYFDFSNETLIVWEPMMTTITVSLRVKNSSAHYMVQSFLF